MDAAQIRAAVLADPNLRSAVERGDDQWVADALTSAAPLVPTGELFTERAVFAAVGPVMAESIFSKLEAFASSGTSGSSVVGRGLKWLQPQEGGLDFQHTDVVQMLTGLQVAGILTEAELSALIRLGLRPAFVGIAEVGEAVAPWRPGGKIQPIPEVN
jgi:hypothetical protein